MKPRAKKKNRKVPCIGCAKDVNRSDAKFCLLDNELFKQFLKELDEAPDYVKENTMCYFWHNTSACNKCPKKVCKAREPRKIEPNKPHKLIDDFNKMKSCIPLT